MDFRLDRDLVATKRGKLPSRRNFLSYEFVCRHLVFVLNVDLNPFSYSLRIHHIQCLTAAETFFYDCKLERSPRQTR